MIFLELKWDRMLKLKKGKNIHRRRIIAWLSFLLDKVSAYHALHFPISLVYVSTFFVKAINEVSYIYYISIYPKLIDRLIQW